MKHTQALGMLFRSTLLCSLLSCSDSTQFSEKTTPADLDSVEGDKIPTETDTGMENPIVEPGTELPDVGLGSRPANKPADDSETSNPEGGNPDETLTDGPGEGNQVPPVAVVPAPAPVAAPAPAAPGQIFLSCTDQPNSPIIAQVFELPAETQRLPDFDAMTSVDDVCISQLNIADRNFDQGFPGVQDLIEWFGLDITFRVYAPVAGNYQFTINSDDGSKLYIDDKLLIDNDGQHAQQEKSASINLSKGHHDFHIKYFQGPRYKIALELFWKKPGQQTRSYIPTEYLSRPQP